jgi:hypothetical protein
MVPTMGSLNPLTGGVQVASNNPLMAPTLGPAAPPSPAVAGDVSAMLQGMNRNGPGPSPGTRVASSVAMGPGYDEQATAKLSQDLLAQHSAAAANYANMAFPNVEALAGYGRGVVTAPGTDFRNTAKGWMNGVSRTMGLPQVFDPTADYDKQHKWLSAVVNANPMAAGSDARLAQTLAGNANTGIHELAGEDMIKATMALMRMNATAVESWQAQPELRAKFGYYANYLRDFNKTTDPRAFAFDLYNAEQRKTLAQDIKKQGKAAEDKFMATYNQAKAAGYLNDPRAMP